ncbi:MAG TPA: DUF4337 domain-containing protein [Desulfomonilaceae bacterium]|nr:DUF4337 domain-containing protein [Desulfomonilaceae bacterium]
MEEKKEEKKEKWLSWLALTTVILALGATLSTLKVGSFSSRSILRQTQASNQWSYYQAKSIKSYLYELQKEKLEVDLKLLGDAAPRDVLQDLRSKMEAYGKKLTTYEKEKSEIQQEARKLEDQRDEATIHSQAFGIAVILLQLSILLSSIAALMKKPMVWVLGLVLGTAGIVAFVNGFLLFSTVFLK